MEPVTNMISPEDEPQATREPKVPPSPAALEATPLSFLYMTLAPLWERFLLGEGALLAVNAALLWFRRDQLESPVTHLVLSVLSLMLLYAFNDHHDAASDRRNPKKNQVLVSEYLRWGESYLWFLLASKALIVTLAYLTIGPTVALVTAALMVVNAAYSLVIKGIPFFDIAVVGLWGALFAGLASAPLYLCAFVGVMTAIMHIYQISVDLEVDRSNEIRTTAVFGSGTTTSMLALTLVALYFVTLPRFGPLWSATAFLPLLFRLAIPRPTWGWAMSRGYCAVALLALLGAFEGLL